eukprot:7439730-Pyramimonas_sp.AAC.1
MTQWGAPARYQGPKSPRGSSRFPNMQLVPVVVGPGARHETLSSCGDGSSRAGLSGNYFF